jgi:hypothetical protein
MSNIEILPSFKVDAILAVHNHLAAINGTKPLADWSKAKSELVGRILKMGDSAAIEAAITATEDGPKPGTKGKVVKTKKQPKAKAKKQAKAKGEKSERKPGVGACAKDIIRANPDMPALDVVAEVQKKFPESSISFKCVGYYRHQLRKAGEIK